MRGALLLLLLPVAGLLAQEAVLPQLQRSTSSSRQFYVYHPDGTLRGRVARIVEDVKEAWETLLKIDNDWKNPIIIQIPTVRPRQARRLQTSVYEGDGGTLKVQIDVYDPTVLKTPEFEREVFRALTLEYTYRDRPLKAGMVIEQPPAWYLDGLVEEVAAKKDGVSTDIYEHLTKAAAPPKLEAFLKQDPERMDAASRLIFRAQSLALLRALLDQPAGARSLVEYLKAIPGSSPENARIFLSKFPALAADPSLLAKIWTLSLAKISAANRIRPISVEETERRLAAILEVAAPPDPKNPNAVKEVGAAAFPAIARSDSGKYILRQKQEELMNLEIRAHPFYKPVVEEYRLIASELAKKPKKNMTKRIAQNNELRELVLKRCNEIDDYVNWFEATQLDNSSPAFESILDGGNGPAPAARRSDAISLHLDRIEREGW